MATTLETTKQYRKFHHWMEIKKLAEEIGVPYYKISDRYNDNGIGLEKPSLYTRFDGTEFNYIRVVGRTRSYPQENQYMADKIYQLSWENFRLKVQLWAIKNNVEVEITEGTNWASTTLKIVVGA